MSRTRIVRIAAAGRLRAACQLFAAAAVIAMIGMAFLLHSGATAQTPRREKPLPKSTAESRDLIKEVLGPSVSMDVDPRRSKLIRTNRPVSRFSVTNPAILEIVQFSPTEFELIGGNTGETTLTLWFGDPNNGEVLRYLVNVQPDTSIEDRARIEYGNLEDRINELFPNSVVQLIPVADKLFVRGQARDSAEAAQILQALGAQSVDQTGRWLQPGAGGYVGGYGGGFNVLGGGTATQPFPGASDLPASQLISLLDVPGEMQVMLKVRIAELTRTANRAAGANVIINAGDFTWTSILGVAGAFSAVLNTDDITLALQAISSNGYSKILAEPNLVTISGYPASFIAGGEFAVPVVVGIDGVAAATTNFRGFGTQVFFIPTIMDKDRIRLQVTPSFSTINSDLTVDGIPGLNSRTVTTTVDLREGQWLALAGLIQDQQAGGKVRVPLLGDLPLLTTIFSRRNIRREETELVILVSPEIVSPMEPKEAPLILPGMEVTEPGDWQFFIEGRYEGKPWCHHRSTVFPNQQYAILDAHHQALREAKQQVHYQKCESYYVVGPHGFSR